MGKPDSHLLHINLYCQHLIIDHNILNVSAHFGHSIVFSPIHTSIMQRQKLNTEDSNLSPRSNNVSLDNRSETYVPE